MFDSAGNVGTVGSGFLFQKVQLARGVEQTWNTGNTSDSKRSNNGVLQIGSGHNAMGGFTFEYFARIPNKSARILPWRFPVAEAMCCQWRGHSAALPTGGETPHYTDPRSEVPMIADARLDFVSKPVTDRQIPTGAPILEQKRRSLPIGTPKRSSRPTRQSTHQKSRETQAQSGRIA